MRFRINQRKGRSRYFRFRKPNTRRRNIHSHDVMSTLRTDGLRQQRRDDAVDTNDSEGGFVLDRDAARVALNKGYLQNLEERRGRPARLVLGEPLPESLELLPNPEALTEPLQVCRQAMPAAQRQKLAAFMAPAISQPE